MFFTYSLVAIIGICVIVFLLLVFQRKREQEKKRRELELLAARSRLETARDNFNRLRKQFYDVENRCNDDRHYHNVKKEELIQLAKQLNDMEEERDNLQKTIDDGAVPEKELNLLENRLNLIEENIEESSTKAKELQDDVNRLEQSVRENEQKFKLFAKQIAQAEQELEQQKELVKIKESQIKS